MSKLPEATATVVRYPAFIEHPYTAAYELFQTHIVDIGHQTRLIAAAYPNCRKRLLNLESNHNNLYSKLRTPLQGRALLLDVKLALDAHLTIEQKQDASIRYVREFLFNNSKPALKIKAPNQAEIIISTYFISGEEDRFIKQVKGFTYQDLLAKIALREKELKAQLRGSLSTLDFILNNTPRIR